MFELFPGLSLEIRALMLLGLIVLIAAIAGIVLVIGRKVGRRNVESFDIPDKIDTSDRARRKAEKIAKKAEAAAAKAAKKPAKARKPEKTAKPAKPGKPEKVAKQPAGIRMVGTPAGFTEPQVARTEPRLSAEDVLAEEAFDTQTPQVPQAPTFAPRPNAPQPPRRQQSSSPFGVADGDDQEW